MGGDDIPERIRTEIKRSQEFVVLLTPHSVDRQWVLLEVGAAWGWSKATRITPILRHVDVDPIPGLIKSKKAIDINGCDDLFVTVHSSELRLAARVVVAEVVKAFDCCRVDTKRLRSSRNS